MSRRVLIIEAAGSSSKCGYAACMLLLVKGDRFGVLAQCVVDAHGDRESGLIVVKEASASHVVPIGTYHGGIPEIIDDGETGFLVLERDVERMSARLATVLNDPALRQRLGNAARLKMEREYDIRRQVALLEGFYDQARARFSAHGMG
jgi:glycosyltransferase involved in cell wall biosynthesis